MVTRNVTGMVDAPKRTIPDIMPWDAEQVSRFFAESDHHDLAALWRLALLTGIRRGELHSHVTPDMQRHATDVLEEAFPSASVSVVEPPQ